MQLGVDLHFGSSCALLEHGRKGASVISAERQEQILRGIQAEVERVGKGFVFPVYLDPTSAAVLISNLQLALRHPENRGPSASIAREVIDGLIQRMQDSGLEWHAEAARLGDNPANDVPSGKDRREKETAGFPVRSGGK